MTEKTREEALAHFGVKGMHWGVRKQPASGKTAKAEAGMDPATIYAAYAVSLLAARGGLAVAQLVDSGNARVLVNKGKRAVTFDKTGPQYKKNLALAKKNMSEDQLMKTVIPDINKGYGSFGTKMNCRRCTMAYEMRRRGNDVVATKSTMATGQHGKGLQKAANTNTKLQDWGEKSVYKDTTSPFSNSVARDAAPKAIFKSLSKEPLGSRGEVAVGWKMGGGHSLAYEIVKGKPVIFDTQRGVKLKTAADFNKHYDLSIGEAAVTRLDNKKLNEDWLERWVQNND